jgi:glycosyltransferase involved in cell wall biosynthesis
MQNNLSKKYPLVTIITPTYNHGEFLEDAILSVKNQTYPNIEHIIFDAQSSDSSLEILKKYESSYRMRWVSEKDSGMSDAINKGIRLAQGDIIAWLNADDVIMYTDSIEQVVTTYLDHNQPEIVVGDMAFIDRAGKIIQLFGYPKIDYSFITSSEINIGQPSVFIRADILKQNILRENLAYVMDFELWLRIGKHGRFVQIRKVLSGSKMYPGTKSSHADLYATEKNQILADYGLAPLKKQNRVKTLTQKHITNFLGIKVRGLFLLILHSYLLRSKLASPNITYHPFPMDFVYQLFRKMHADYSTYWPSWMTLGTRRK